MYAERRAPEPIPPSEDDVVLTMSLTEAGKLRHLFLENITIPEALARARGVPPRRTKELLDDIRDALSEANVPLHQL